MPDLDVQGTRLYYETQGEGETIAFLNGILMNAQGWVLQTRHLRRRFRCLTHDFRGQLRSGRPPGPYSLEQHRDDFIALLDHLEIERCHLVGTSYGGEVGLRIAADCPERITSLAVLAGTGEVEPELRRRAEDWLFVLENRPESFVREMLAEFYTPQFLEENPGLVVAAQVSLEGCGDDFYVALRELVQSFLRLDLSDALGRIRCPTLVVGAEKDRLKPVNMSRRLAEAIPGARLEIIPKAGHAVMIEAAEAVNQLLSDWMTSTHEEAAVGISAS